VVRNYFKEALEEERKQLTIVFSVFFGVVTVVMVVSFTLGNWATIINNVTVRRFLENTFALVTEFPCIFVILYFHHINYRPAKLETLVALDEPEMKSTVSVKQQSSIQLDEEPLELMPRTRKNSLSQNLTATTKDFPEQKKS
jgi:hypothetical protein